MLNDDGAAVVDAIFGLLITMLLVLGVAQVGLTLYARNVVLSAAHEGVRAAVERGRTLDEARAIATKVIQDAAGGAVRIAVVETTSETVGAEVVLDVSVRAAIRPLGIVPIEVPVDVVASASRPAGLP